MPTEQMERADIDHSPEADPDGERFDALLTSARTPTPGASRPTPGASRPTITAVAVTILGLIACGAVLRTPAVSADGGSVEGDEIIADVEDPGDSTGGSDPCTWTAVTRPDPSDGQLRPVTRRRGSTTQTLMAFDCPGPPRRTGTKWITRRDGSRSSARRRLPTPGVWIAPPAGSGVVNVPTWFWVPRTVWRPWSVSATVVTPAGPVTVITTATPQRLILQPGDGSAPKSCRGPGRSWMPAHGDHAPSTCTYTYRRASNTRPGGAFAASVSIDWKVTWRSSLGAGGRLPNIRTTTPFASVVREIQAIASR